MEAIMETSSSRHRKRDSQHAVRRNISLPPILDAQADSLAAKYACSSFSDYVQARMRKDLGIDFDK